MAITIKLGASVTNTKFVAADLTSILINISGADVAIGTVGATVTNDTTITIPGYGTITKASATGTAATFTALAAFPAGTVTLTDGTAGANPVLFTAADFSAVTGAITFVAGGENLTIVGAAGDNTITAGAKTTTVTTAAGSDAVTTAALTTAVNTGAGNDTISHGTTAVATLNAGAGNDTVNIAAAATGANVVLLGDGDDTISAAALGTATVTMGLGADVASVASGAAVLTVTDYNYAQGDKIVNLANAATGTLNTTGLFNIGSVNVTTTATDNVYKAKYNYNAGAGNLEYWTAGVGVSAVTMNGSGIATAIKMDASGAANAVIQGGYGDDDITLGASQVTVTSSKSTGNDKLTNFTDGFSGDVINLSGSKIADLSFGAGIVALGGITVANGLTDYTGTANKEGSILVQENGGTVKKVNYAAAAAATLTNLTADVYVGATNTTVDASASTVEGATYDLNNSAKFVNVANIKGAAGGGTYIGSTLAGVANKIDLSAATKASQVWTGSSATDLVTLEAAKAVQDVVWFGKTDGTDTVTNFGYGFGTTKDIINLYNVTDATALDYTVGGGANDVVLTTATGNTVSLAGAAPGGLNAAQLQVKNQAGTVTKLAVGVKAGTATTIDGTGADMVIGKTEAAGTANSHTVSVSVTGSALTMNLLDTTKFKNVHNVDLSGITTAAAGTTNVVVGNADTVTGSSLKLANSANVTTDVWGGSVAADSIVAAGGVDTIWYGTGDGLDGITGFTAATDKVKFYDKAVSELTGAYTYGWAGGTGTFTSTKNTTTDKLTVNITDDTAMNIVDKNNLAVKAVVGNTNLTYNKDAKVYISGTAASTLSVGATATENVFLYLGNGTDMAYNDSYFANISTINATAAIGSTTLIGSKSVNNTLQGGKVSSAMWGGGMSSDTMTGQTSAVDQYWFGTGDGIDSVSASGVDKADTVVIYNAASINDVTMTIGTNQEVIAMKDGSMLTIGDTGNAAVDAGLTFQVGTGSAAKSYTYNRTTKAFVAK